MLRVQIIVQVLYFVQKTLKCSVVTVIKLNHNLNEMLFCAACRLHHGWMWYSVKVHHRLNVVFCEGTPQAECGILWRYTTGWMWYFVQVTPQAECGILWRYTTAECGILWRYATGWMWYSVKVHHRLNVVFCAGYTTGWMWYSVKVHHRLNVVFCALCRLQHRLNEVFCAGYTTAEYGILCMLHHRLNVVFCAGYTTGWMWYSV